MEEQFNPLRKALIEQGLIKESEAANILGGGNDIHRRCIKRSSIYASGIGFTEDEGTARSCEGNTDRAKS